MQIQMQILVHHPFIRALSSQSSFHHPCFLSLVLTRTRLTRLQLIQVPPADIQTALVIIHALPEVLDIALAGAAAALAVLGVVCLVLVCEVGGLCGFGRRGALRRRRAAEHAA